MKTYKQTSEIIDYIKLFHERMGNLYGQIYEKAKKQRIKMLVEYLRRHEKHREETLMEYKSEASSKVLESWFKYVPENLSLNCIEDIEIKSNMTVDEIVEITLKLNDCIIKFYEELVEEADIEEVKSVFISLLKRLKQEEKNLVRDVARLNDI